MTRINHLNCNREEWLCDFYFGTGAPLLHSLIITDYYKLRNSGKVKVESIPTALNFSTAPDYFVIISRDMWFILREVVSCLPSFLQGQDNRKHQSDLASSFI